MTARPTDDELYEIYAKGRAEGKPHPSQAAGRRALYEAGCSHTAQTYDQRIDWLPTDEAIAYVADQLSHFGVGRNTAYGLLLDLHHRIMGSQS